MKLLLFGGAFDPPHIGHMSLLDNAIFVVKPDKVVVMPSGTPPHRGASPTPPQLRLEMCECFRPLFPNLVVSGMEMSRAGKSYTYDTVMELKKQNPGAGITVAIGSDMLLSFTTWHRYEELLKEAALLVQIRSDADLEPSRHAAEKIEKLGAVINISNVPEPISSTLIRAGIRAGQDVYDMIPPPADRIVRQNRLYRD